MKKIKVILLDNVKWQWFKWDVIEVYPSYAQNVLFRKNLAKNADSLSLNQIKQLEEKRNKEKVDFTNKLNIFFNELEKDWWLIIEKEVSEKWTLYDKIDSKEIINIVNEKFKIELQKSNIQMDSKIETLWEFKIKFEDWEIKKNIIIKVVKKIK